MAAKYVAAVDHGTTSTRCILFDGDGAPTATTQRGQTMHYPRPGWLELDMTEVWQRTQECIQGALSAAGARSATRLPISMPTATVATAIRHILRFNLRLRGGRPAGRAAAVR